MNESGKNGTAEKSHQQVMGPDGKPLFVLVPVAEYEMLANLGEAAGELGRARAALAERLGGMPAGVAHRIADGENPVRVWREFRGLKAIALARAAGISPAYLSEIETGKKDGTFRTMAAVARVLGVSLDDLAPPADESGRRLRERNALIDGVRAQVRTLVTLVTGPVDFNTAAVRRTVTTLAADAVALKARECNPDGWLDGVLAGVRDVLDLVDRAEGDIIATAQMAQRALEDIVNRPVFQPPEFAEGLSGEPAGHAGPNATAAE